MRRQREPGFLALVTTQILAVALRPARPGAISKTAAGGEICVLDPGGFGAVTITKAISITDGGVGEAGVLVSGTNGIVVAAGATDVVNLRGRYRRFRYWIVRCSCKLCSRPICSELWPRISPGAGLELESPLPRMARLSSCLARLCPIIAVASKSLQRPLVRIILAVLNRVQVENSATFGIKVDGTIGTGAISATVRDSVSAGISATAYALPRHLAVSDPLACRS